MSERKDKLRQTIESDDAASLTIFSRVSPEQWEQPVPSDEGATWRARDVLNHVTISEGGQLVVIQRILAGQGGVPEDFDLNRYNRRAVQKQVERTVDDMLTSIGRDHAQVLAALDGMSEADLDMTGRHARGDTLTVAQFFHRITEHRRQHAEELARNLGL
jgi:hypothetical protein